MSEVESCALHPVGLLIRCVECDEEKRCWEFERSAKRRAGHRHVCGVCDSQRAGITPRPWEIAVCRSKERFESELDAIEACAWGVRKAGALSVYGPCVVCGGWHKTGRRLRWSTRGGGSGGRSGTR